MEILKTFLGSVLQYLMLNTAFKPFSIIYIIKSLALWFLSILKHLRFCLVKNVKKSRDTQPLKVYAFLNVHNGILGWFGQLARRCYQKIDPCYIQIYSCYQKIDPCYRQIYSCFTVLQTDVHFFIARPIKLTDFYWIRKTWKSCHFI